MDHSGRLALPYLAAGQMQKHVTVNEVLTRLDVLVQCRVISRTVAVPPDDPDEGDLYVLPAGGLSGGWSAFAAGDLVRSEPGGWLAQEVSDGLMVLVADEGAVLIRRDGDWRLLGAMLGEAQGLTRLGLNAVADAGNPLSARLGNALFAAVSDEEGGGEGDLRLTLNKAGPSDVLSLVFQSGWEGRAEMGLVGDDDLILKVADDDGVWREALRIDRVTARGAFAFGAGRVEASVLTADASWSPPAWARRVEARVVAGGGGGGDGGFGTSPQSGGGGGGAGGMAVAVWGADMLAVGLDVVVGAGGAAGDDGQDTTISLEGQTILRALGGEAGGAAGVVAGAGGLGEVAGNSGAPGQTGAGLSGQERIQPFGPGGGGGGGGLSGGLAFDGGAGGQGGLLGAPTAGGSGGVADVGEPGSDPAMELWPWCGGGGGGGAATDTGAGYAGGAGGLGAGGGGGGAGLTSGGPGGAGGGGCVVLTAVG